MQRCRCDICFY